MKKLIYGFVSMMFILAGQVIVDVAHAGETTNPTMQEMAIGVLRSIIEAATQDYLGSSYLVDRIRPSSSVTVDLS